MLLKPAIRDIFPKIDFDCFSVMLFNFISSIFCLDESETGFCLNNYTFSFFPKIAILDAAVNRIFSDCLADNSKT